MPSEFKNEPILDFSKPENEKAMQAALKKVASSLGAEYNLIIGGKKVKSAKKITSINPADPDMAIGHVAKALRDQAEEAIQVALNTFETCSRPPAP
jgi:1-pyrroline-5-carboxylate dehydrogenase